MSCEGELHHHPNLPEDINAYYSINFPNLSAVSASECNIQSTTTIASGVIPEAELTITVDKGVNTSTRDLVLAAISVMKGRKARPDTKRLCNWVNRKYGRAVQDVVSEIDELCTEGILEKVEYKGSISFRITSQKKLHKRVGRRKNSQLSPGFSPALPFSSPDSSYSPVAYSRQTSSGYMSAGSGYLSTDGSPYMAADFTAGGFGNAYPLDSSAGATDSPIRGPGPTGGLIAEMSVTSRNSFPKAALPSPKKSPPKSPGAARPKEPTVAMERTEPVTLNLIVREELNPAPNCVVTKGDIANAVELTARPINKRAVYRDLETILAHEIHLGYVLKHGDNAFSLPDISKGRNTYRGTIPLKSSKRKPKPSQKYLESTQKYLEMEAELARFRQDKFSGLLCGLPETLGSVTHYEMPYPANGTATGVALETAISVSAGGTGAPATPHSKTEDELKDDLIKEKLISNNLLKMKSKMKSNKVKVKKEDPGNSTGNSRPVTVAAVAMKDEVCPPIVPLANMAIKQEAMDSADEKPRSPSTKKLRLKKETWHLADSVIKQEKSVVAVSSEEGLTRTASPASHKTLLPPLAGTSIKLEVKEEAAGEGNDCGEHEKPQVRASGTPVPAAPPSAKAGASSSTTSSLSSRDPAPKGRSVVPEPRKERATKQLTNKVGKKTTAQKRKREEDSEDELSDSPPPPPTPPLTRTLSGRKKRARKIFDPADHDLPSRIIRKFRSLSPVQPEALAAGHVEAPTLRNGHSAPKKSFVRDQPVPSTDGAGRRGSYEPTTRKSAERTTTPDLQVRRAASGVEPVARTAGKKSYQEQNLDVVCASEKSSVQSPPLTKTDESKKSSASPKTELAPALKADLTDHGQKKSKHLATTEKSDKAANVTAVTTTVKRSPASSGGSNGQASDLSSSSPAMPRKVASPALSAAKKPGPAAAAAPMDNKKHMPPSAKNHEKVNCEAAATKLQKLTPKAAAVESKKAANHTFLKPSPKTANRKSGCIKSPAELTSGSKGGKQVKSPQSKTGQKSATAAAAAVVQPLTVSLRAKKDPKDRAICMVCEMGNKRNEKLIFCKNCNKIVHPSCLNYPEDLTDRIYKQPWQCIDCKTCCLCEKSDNDDKMLFCDSCDLGFHMSCHQPAIASKPRGRWECDSCATETGFKAELDEKASPGDPARYFEELMPPLPAGVGPWPGGGPTLSFCPAPDLYPPSWQDMPIDESVPDISGWSAARMSQYLVQNGLKEKDAKIFFEQELDGRCVLLLQRHDVLQNLGLKLGPALKIYKHIKRLQTRRRFAAF